LWDICQNIFSKIEKPTGFTNFMLSLLGLYVVFTSHIKSLCLDNYFTKIKDIKVEE